MRIKIASNRVYEVADPVELLHRLHETSATLKKQTFREYLEGFVARLRPLKVWLDVPASVAGGSDQTYAEWLSGEMFKVGRWSETTAPTEEEKEAKAKAAAEARAKAAKEKAAKARAEKEAAAKAAAAKEPAAKEPAAKEPAAKEPAARESAAKEPAAKGTTGSSSGGA